MFTPIVHASPSGFKYTETRWRDKPNYKCCHCNFSTLHEPKMEEHFVLAHTPQEKSLEVLIFDANGRPMGA